jgi:hypothetical protein
MRALAGGDVATAAAGNDARWRPAALHTGLSWGARPRAQAVPRRSTDDGETNWGGADGGGATVRRRGSVRRRTPTSDCGRCEAWGRPQATPGCSSPPCAAPGWSHGDEAAAEPRFRRRRRKTRVRVPVAAAHEGKAARVGTSRGGGRLIRAGRTALACGPRTGKRASLGPGGGGGVRGGDGQS